ncbi:MazG family protein [Cellulomonas sp. Root137]|uniref:MazG family protein n=1 Tax=Cellulomonas sp. Root137 TaxID=1736459 RepID=UPI0006F68509|nr:MazG family protein [Cellulomonas sp. Root137]KQY42930.1 nucleoside triphosphate hydrolase [Cellulomonas sp. Root137]KRD45503.1 nucleoside triphosphate hydrolase [Cellulomonas sp. Root930]
MTDPQPDSLRALVRVMDRLRSPGGCPWDAQQTHESLVPYVLEEAHELAEAIETDDRVGLREELGDLLLQVVFHARIATEHPTDPFDVDDVAADLVAKLVRRHPHVFEGAPVEGDVHVQWDRLKNAEKQRGSALDGIPLAIGALARGQKVLARAQRAGIDAAGLAREVDPPDEVGRRLLGVLVDAEAHGVDAESALRGAVRQLEDAVRAVEQVSRRGPSSDR